MKCSALEGVPYTDEMIENAKADLERQVDPDAERRSRTSSRAIRRRRCGSSTATRGYVSELDALIAYLQMLGTLGRLRHLRRRRSQSEVRLRP